MRCKHCDYRLWNLRSRNCPECGKPFRVSDYEFAINSVQFCCPHCGQDYYGTGERGHLRPFEFDCVRCKQRVNMDEMVLLPTAGFEESQTQTERMPWLDDARRPLSRWLGTLQMALTRPADLLRLTPVESSSGAAWRFFLVTWIAVILGATGLLCVFPIFMLVGGIRGMITLAFGDMGVALIAGLAMLLFGGFFWSLLVHSILRASGPTFGGFGRTQQAILYSSGANVLTGIPCLGPAFGWIWWVVSAVIATREAQRVSVARACVAVISPVLLALAGLVGLYVWTISLALTTRTGAAAWPAAFAANATTGTLAGELTSFASTHDNAFPVHPAQLLENNPALAALDFVTLGGSDAAQVFIGDVALEQFDSISEQAQKRAVAKAAAQIGEKPAPVFRFGDFVFVYGGVDPSKATWDTWLVVGVIPQPNSTAPSNSMPTAWADIRTFGGNMTVATLAELGSLLDQQNRTRAEAGVPEIPRAEFLASMQASTTTPATAPTEKAAP